MVQLAQRKLALVAVGLEVKGGLLARLARLGGGAAAGRRLRVALRRRRRGQGRAGRRVEENRGGPPAARWAPPARRSARRRTRAPPATPTHLRGLCGLLLLGVDGGQALGAEVALRAQRRHAPAARRRHRLPPLCGRGRQQGARVGYEGRGTAPVPASQRSASPRRTIHFHLSPITQRGASPPNSPTHPPVSCRSPAENTPSMLVLQPSCTLTYPPASSSTWPPRMSAAWARKHGSSRSGWRGAGWRQRRSAAAAWSGVLPPGWPPLLAHCLRRHLHPHLSWACGRCRRTGP